MIDRDKMNGRDNSFEAWEAERDRMEAWCETVDAALGPVERRMPRDPVEARILRAMGTPEELIGPGRRSMPASVNSE